VLKILAIKEENYYSGCSPPGIKGFRTTGGSFKEVGGSISKEEEMNLKLYVGNLPFGISEDDLRKLFAEAGEVQSVKIVTDSYSGQSRGFGFVEMASKEAAEKAISLVNGKSVMNRTLTVNEARPQKKRGGDFRGGRDRDR
jgi:RNA recognition motif-containing protein